MHGICCHWELFRIQVLEVCNSVHVVISPTLLSYWTCSVSLETSRLSGPASSHGPSCASRWDSMVRVFNPFLSALRCPLASVFICLAHPWTCLAIFKVIYSAWGLSTTLHSNSTFLCVFPSSLPHPHPPWRGNSSLCVAPYPVLSLLFQNLVLRLISPLVSSVFIACKWLSP